MEIQKDMQSVIADNLANVNTSGFKAMHHLYKSFNDDEIINNVTGEKLGTMASGVDEYDTQFDYSQGPLQQTGNALDLAIQGKGFLPVQTPNGDIEYTRNGRFTLDKDGFLVTQSGEFLVDDGLSPIFLGIQGIRDFTVLRNGNVVINGEFIAHLNTFEFPDGMGVIRKANDKYAAADPSAAMNKSQKTTIVQGFIENSNVSAIKSSTDMVQVMRSYQANQRALKTQFSTLEMLMQISDI